MTVKFSGHRLAAARNIADTQTAVCKPRCFIQVNPMIVISSVRQHSSHLFQTGAPAACLVFIIHFMIAKSCNSTHIALLRKGAADTVTIILYTVYAIWDCLIQFCGKIHFTWISGQHASPAPEAFPHNP